MNEYILQIWEHEKQDDWQLQYHKCNPQEILIRIKEFKRNNPKWYEWKPKICQVKEVNLDSKVLAENIKDFMGVGTFWEQIRKELKKDGST